MTAVEQSFENLLEYVRDARGFDYTGYRRPSLMRRFEKRIQTVGAGGYDDYRAYLETHPEEFGQLFDAILINVTGFFRDSKAWDVVASDVIPALLERKDKRAPIRVWSAGCASGEEPFTIAMLLAEAIGEEAFRARVKVYATDVDEEALAQARDAVYTLKQLDGGHCARPANSTTAAAMPSSASTASTAPVWIAAPGIPKCSDVVSSCATTVPPACLTAAAPRAPSRPLPERTTARQRLGCASASDESRTSALGRRWCTGGESSRRRLPPAVTSRCMSGGAT